jgi:uncharacterized protein YndB with AHSA1/START domain
MAVIAQLLHDCRQKFPARGLCNRRHLGVLSVWTFPYPTGSSGRRIEVAMTAATESSEVPTEGAQGAPVVEVSRVVPFPIDKVWQLLSTSAGAEALLGRGAKLGAKGEPWRSVDGSHGVVRSYHPMEQVRLTWHADDHAAASLVDLRLIPEGGDTRLQLRHERIDDPTLGQSLPQRWNDALSRIGGPTA